MIPAVTGFLPRRRPAPPVAGWRACGPENLGDTSQQAPGRLPHWPADWHRRWPLDPLVFGAVPRVHDGTVRSGL